MQEAISALKKVAEADPQGVSLSPAGASELSLKAVDDVHGLPLPLSYKALLTFSDGATVYGVRFSHAKLLQRRSSVIDLGERDMFIIGRVDEFYLLIDPDDDSLYTQVECSPDIRQICTSLEDFILALVRSRGRWW